MKYRAKIDAIVTDKDGTKTLIAIGDKVFIQQMESGWEAYSFFTRKLLAVLTKEQAEAIFAPESEFERPRELGSYHNKFKNRSFRNFLIFLISTLPLGSIAQDVGPIHWSLTAVKMQEERYELQLESIIEPGWWLCTPNTPNVCIRPFTIKMTTDVNGFQLGAFEIKEHEMSKWDPGCGDMRYYNHILIVCPIWVKANRTTLIKLTIIYQPSAKYGPGETKTVTYYYPIGEEDKRIKGEGKYTRLIPKGIGKVWWRVSHPFQKPFWIP